MASLLGIVVIVLSAGLTRAQQNNETTDDGAPAERSYIQFRHIEPKPPEVDLNAVGPVRFLTDSTFPPFSYKTRDGALTGFNVSLADAMCKDLRLHCEFIVKPWEELLPSLEAGEGDAILSGIRILPDRFDDLDFTKPFFLPFAKFVVRTGNPVEEPGNKAFAGRRIGVLKASVHEAFLNEHFPRSRVHAYDSLQEAREALRQGKLDALFEDSVQAMFWLTGEASRGCCRFAGGGFRDRVYLDMAMAIAVKRGNKALRDVLDHGLDRLQSSGQYIQIYRSFFPLEAW